MNNLTARPASRLYFGWLAVALLSLCSATLIGVAISSFVMFAAPLAQEFGWTESQTGSIVSAMWFTAPVALLAGPIAKRFGTWSMVAAGMGIQVLALTLVPFTFSFGFLFGLRLFMGFGLVLIIAASPVIVASWFKRHFATAMAIVWSAAAGGQIVFAPVTVALNDVLGWRNTCFVLSGLLAIPALLALSFMRGPQVPADVGQHVDGAPDASATSAEDEGEETLGWHDTVRSINWITAAFMCVAVVGGGMSSLAYQSQAPALYGAMGMDAQTAAWLFSTFSFAALIGSIASGWLLDRSPAIIMCVAVGSLVIGGFLLLQMTLTHPAIGPATAGTAAVGLGLGAGEVLWITLFKRQFGTAAFATTYGIFYFSFQVGMGSGGFLGGLTYERYGAAGLIHFAITAYMLPFIFSIWRPGGRNTMPPAPVPHLPLSKPL